MFSVVAPGGCGVHEGYPRYTMSKAMHANRLPENIRRKYRRQQAVGALTPQEIPFAH
jgi:hypothetical protein